MDALNEFQNIIDENKDNLTDGIYVQLCDSLKRKFDQLKVREKNNTSYYKCTFIDAKFRLVSLADLENNYCLQFTTFTRILKMNESSFNEIKDDIEAKGISDTPFFNCNKDQRLISAFDAMDDDRCYHTEITIDTRSSMVRIEKL